MKRITLLLAVLASAVITGCSASHIEPPPPQSDPRLGRAPYWYAQPAVAQIHHPDYDKLWLACEDEARERLFPLDREDYREGLLTTRPIISKQLFELWRNDTGDARGVVQNSLQMIRRTIRFRFEKSPDGYTVTPRVLIERYSQPTRHITTVSQYNQIFNFESADSIVGAQAEVPTATTAYWYAIGRDTALETQIAGSLQNRLH